MRHNPTEPAPWLRDLSLLVLGLGNLICSDDGLGPRLVERLCAAWNPVPGVEVADGGTLGLSLMPLVERAERLLIVDDIAADAPAGTLVRLDGEAVAPAVAERLSPHQVGVVDLLGGLALLGRLPRQVTLLGLVPRSIDLGVELTADVAAALPALEAAVLREAAVLGFPFEVRGETTTPSSLRGAVVGTAQQL